MNFQTQLIQWYRLNKRDLPWRQTRNPYFIWLSEIILQQTRVAQGMAYYQRFVSEFPTVVDLASADEEAVLKLWQGLGYYSRARNLHYTAKQIVALHQGKFPTTYEEIRSLKGVGDYTAAAISSFAFNKAHAVVDGNVYRVLSRYFGLENPIDTSTGKKEYAALANQLLDKKNPGEYNQAIMEFGALQCVPKLVNCAVCCFTTTCIAAQQNKQNFLPIKAKKTKQRTRYINYFFIECNEQVLVRQRGAGDIWQGLYEFPFIETENFQNENELLSGKEWQKIFAKSNPIISNVSGLNKHVLTHQILQVRFWKISVTELHFKHFLKHYKAVHIEELNHLPWSRLFENYLQNHKA